MSDPLNIAGINAAGQMASTAANIASTNRMNKKTREWNERMYQQQKQDNIDFWNMQNQYNDPSMQMQRLKAAGLNPNLVYGNGSAANQAGDVKAPNKPQWNPETPKVNFSTSEMLNQMYALPNLQAQSDNLRKNNELMEAQRLKTAAETANLGIKGAQDQLSLDLSKSLFDTTIEKAKADLENTRQNTIYTVDQNKRQEALNKATLAQAAATLIQTTATTENVRKSTAKLTEEINNLLQNNRILKVQARMWENNQNPNDPTWMRWAMVALQTVVDSFMKPESKPSRLTPQELSDPTKVVDRYKLLRENEWRWK